MEAEKPTKLATHQNKAKPTCVVLCLGVGKRIGSSCIRSTNVSFSGPTLLHKLNILVRPCLANPTAKQAGPQA